MADRLARAAARLNVVRKAHMATSVVYSRAPNSVTVSATLGDTSYEATDLNGITVQTKMLDFIIATTDLILDSVQVLPESGDEIRLVQGSDTLVFEVLPIGDTKHYRMSDPHGEMLRIHAKQTGVE